MTARRPARTTGTALAALWLAGLLVLAATAPATIHAEAPSGGPAKVLRYAFPTAETGFDPVQIADLYSRTVTAHVFEAPYAYDPLAHPARLVPRTAAGPPEHSADYTEWTVRLRPGIRFADDPAFGGRPRELTAADYVYSWKRVFDPALKSPSYPSLREEGIVGLEALRRRALDSGRPFDYDGAVEGLTALDRYTLRIRLTAPRPRFASSTLAAGDVYGAVAREVVERYGDRIAAHPVGTGPFRLAQWRRSSLIVLERNDGYRDQRYEAEPSADDAEGTAIAARLRGRRLPLVDRVEIAVIDEGQPRWLAFLNGQHDLLQALPPEYAPIAVPGGELAPHLARRGIVAQRRLNPDVSLTVYNMEDPVVGGLAPERVALRRALNLAYDVGQEIRLVRREQGVPAQSMVTPDTYGYDPDYRSTNSEHDVARANALLDLYGYVDRDGDGWRDRPDGSPLVIRLASSPEAIYRQLAELRQRGMDAIRVRLDVQIGQWAEQLKAARAGRFMIWTVASSASSPDGQPTLEMAYGPAIGGSNLARFSLPAYDRLYERMKPLPDGPERQALFRDAKNLLAAYAPYRAGLHRIGTDLAQPWLHGYRRPAFGLDFWQHVDIDTAQQAEAGR